MNVGECHTLRNNAFKVYPRGTSLVMQLLPWDALR
jgi:hypothetical protein